MDADTHLTDTWHLSGDAANRFAESEKYYHGRPICAETLLACMELSEVDLSLAWQNPAGWTDPKALGVKKAVWLAEHCILKLGMGIVKMNPAQNQFPINSGTVLEVVEAITGSGAVVAFHFGSDTSYAPASVLEDVVDRYPDVPIVAYQTAGSPYKEHLMCGSDAPYANQLFQFGGLRALLGGYLQGSHYPDSRLEEKEGLFDEESVQGYLGGNFARLMSTAYKRLLLKYYQAWR